MRYPLPSTFVLQNAAIRNSFYRDEQEERHRYAHDQLSMERHGFLYRGKAQGRGNIKETNL
jgi:hypothetical protein